MRLRKLQTNIWDFIPAGTTMVTLGNLSPGLDYVISVITQLDDGGRSPPAVVYITPPPIMTSNQGNSIIVK